jgi:hypothetical protein
MKISYLEKKVALKFVFILLFILLTISTNDKFSNVYDSIIQQRDQVQKNIVKTSKQGEEFNAYKDTLYHIIKLWDQIERKEELYIGLNIDEGYKILNFLEEKYNLNLLNATILTPEVLEQKSIADKEIVILYSIVELQIASATDFKIYDFIQNVMDSFPGYVSISRLHVAEVREFDDSIIKEIDQTGIWPSLIKTEVTFEWRDIKSINNGSL